MRTPAGYSEYSRMHTKNNADPRMLQLVHLSPKWKPRQTPVMRTPAGYNEQQSAGSMPAAQHHTLHTRTHVCCVDS
jgi:hypothetical protein